jgi:hypothetical protein
MEMLVIALVAIVAFAAVLLPLMRRGEPSASDELEFDTGAAATAVAEEAVPPIGAGPATPLVPMTEAALAEPEPITDIEQEVLRYRTALRAGTLCVRCGEANPPGSRFCADCGKRLPLADAKEFE